MEITKEYFRKEMIKFREMMGDKRFTVEQVSKALGGLLSVYAECTLETPEDKEWAQRAMDALCLEHDKRLQLRLTHNI